MVEPERPQAIWRMRVACWISKATRARVCTRLRARAPTYARKHAHRQPFPRQQWFRERTSMLRYTYIALLVIVLNTSLLFTAQRARLWPSPRLLNRQKDARKSTF